MNQILLAESQKTFPSFTWEINNSTGEIVATLNEHGLVHEALVWSAFSCGTNTDGKQRRDFRIASIDKPLDPAKPLDCGCGVFDAKDGYCSNLKSFWSHATLEPTTVRGKRTYSAHMDAPTDGRWVAYFIDITYAKTDITPALANEEASAQRMSRERERQHKGFVPKDLAGRMEFTTEVSVYPNTFPYAGCGVDAPDFGACTDTLI